MSTTPLLADKLEAVTFRNARSFKGTHDLPLSPGLTAIIGDSDVGKSNVVRNVLSIIHNDSLAAMVTAGEPNTYVQIKAPDATVYLKKGDFANVGKKGVNAYTVQTTQGHAAFDSVGSSVPDGVSGSLLLGPYDLGGIEIDLHVSTQRGAAFGVDHSPSELAKIVGSVSGIDSLYRAVGLAEKARKEATSAARFTGQEYQKAVGEYRAAKRELEGLNIPTLAGHLQAAVTSQTQWQSYAQRVDIEATSMAKATAAIESGTRLLADITTAHQQLEQAVNLADQWVSYTGQFTTLLAAYDSAQQSVGVSSRALAQIDSQQQAAQRAVAELEALLRSTQQTCPTCGQSSDALTILEHTHG